MSSPSQFVAIFAGLMVALAIAVPVSAKDAKPTSAASAVVAAAAHIDNFGRVNEHYYRGANPTGRDFAELAKLGVKATIDLTNGDDEDSANSAWPRAP